LISLLLDIHIILPFDLHKNPEKFHERANHDLHFEVFPDTQMVSFDGWVLVYCLLSLPPKPWPRKIAGVPRYLTTDPNNLGPVIPTERRSRSRITVSDDLDFRDNEEAKDTV
jgi:hypothetical protein